MMRIIEHNDKNRRVSANREDGEKYFACVNNRKKARIASINMDSLRTTSSLMRLGIFTKN